MRVLLGINAGGISVFLIICVLVWQKEQSPWQRHAPVLLMISVETSTLVGQGVAFTYQGKHLSAMCSIQMSATLPRSPKHFWVQSGCPAMIRALAPKMEFQEL